MTYSYTLPSELTLGSAGATRIPLEDQQRQRREAAAILERLASQPGVVLADEVGMGKTFVALSVAYAVARQARSGPVVIMVPANLVDKWVQDLASFCQLYTPGVTAVPKAHDGPGRFRTPDRLLFGVARRSVELMRLLDDPLRERAEVILLASTAMSRGQSDKWVRLAFIAETFRRHGKRAMLAQVKPTAHRFLGELLEAIGEQRGHLDDEWIWDTLLRKDPSLWREVYNAGVKSSAHRLDDDPIPKALQRALPKLDLTPLVNALALLPVRASGDAARMRERIRDVRAAVRKAEGELWLYALSKMSWRSPLLILDEAHHLKNPKTTLAQMFQEVEDGATRVGAGAIHGKFDRMCFLTATPFQLGHRELVNVLRRFGGVRWDKQVLGDHSAFEGRIDSLAKALDRTQGASIRFQKSWSRLDVEDAEISMEWSVLRGLPREPLRPRVRAALDAFDGALKTRLDAQAALQPWIIRHNKGTHWDGGAIVRRVRQEGARMGAPSAEGGIRVPGEQLVPFFLAARSAILAEKDLLGEALASSYEAFRRTRASNKADRDDQDEGGPGGEAATNGLSKWYLERFDRSLEDRLGRHHPKVDATVTRVADLWEQGEKVLVFAFYRKTCQALRFHISREIESRLYQRAAEVLGGIEGPTTSERVAQVLERVQSRFFDDAGGPGRRALDSALANIVSAHNPSIEQLGTEPALAEQLRTVIRRFLRVESSLLRSFPIAELERLKPAEAVEKMLEHQDASGLSWRTRLGRFLDFLVGDCSPQERLDYLAALERMETGGIRVEMAEGYEASDLGRGAVLLANVQVATGQTKREQRGRLMRGFNTPFFPEVLVCSEVMGEGVDLHRACRHVIHHDLAWNPSQIEQRTGRVDRLGCKAEGVHPILVDMPFLSGMTDERQYKVMTDREQWFKVVMGQEDVAALVAADGPSLIPLPEEAAAELAFRLGL